ncbi:uncharacterized protein LOC113275352 isoform X2 [Papaver somniferum]|uniref:uncharacterized protein LOC113275352 isoform X2 n=1 Tax=Papaver somniferum TaxID=3469 RepID=UPI000E7044A4|nr:uncharacterized protein LOC113275352 isoform X2 [Papaver somniferum]XP_026380619.1 uncharacterized protein LOC113275352 isoform X2 [Papaver somniferum]
MFLLLLRQFSQLLKSSLALAKSFVIENDLIKFEHNGREIVGVVRDVVHHVGDLMETTLQCEHGLEKFKISIFDVVNVTYRYYEGKERMWGIHTTVECKDGDVEKMVEEIKDILNAHDDVKCNSKLVMMDSLCPKNNKIIVMSFVTCSKLRSPPYVHYMEVRRKVLSEIDEIQRKHEVRRKVLLEIEEVLSK